MTNQRDRWLEVEVEFTSTPEFTDELTFKYYILVNGKLLTGEVTHMNVTAGRDNRSVMYVPPKALARLMGKSSGDRELRFRISPCRSFSRAR